MMRSQDMGEAYLLIPMNKKILALAQEIERCNV